MKSICPWRISGHSAGIGSFTFTIMSARAKISSGPLTISQPCAQIVVVGDARPEAGTGLDEHLVPAADEFFDADRQHGHAVFVQLDLFRHTHDHGNWPLQTNGRPVRLH